MERLSLAALLGWTVLATALALSPYSFAWSCLICVNGATLDADAGRLVLESPGIARAPVPEAFSAALAETGSLVVELAVTPDNARQSGPARILSYSSGPYSRNFTIGQAGDRLVVRLRTSPSDPNGRRGEIVLPGVFAAGETARIRIRHAPDGTSVETGGPASAHLAGLTPDFGLWDDSFALLIGNETTGDRPWLGSVGRITIRAGPPGPILADFDFSRPDRSPPGALSVGDLRVPTLFPVHVPLRGEHFQMKDFALHIGMLFPVGFLAALAFARPRRDRAALAAAMLAVVAFALAIEVAQHFNVKRTMSALDFFWGVIGGLLGALAGLWVRLRVRRGGAPT